MSDGPSGYELDDPHGLAGDTARGAVASGHHGRPEDAAEVLRVAVAVTRHAHHDPADDVHIEVVAGVATAVGNRNQDVAVGVRATRGTRDRPGDGVADD